MSAPIIPLQPSGAARVEISDEALLAACVAREPVALGGLYDRYSAPIARCVSRLIGAHHADVEDLVQATFTEVWRSASRFRGASSAKAWIFGIALNLSRRYLRDSMRGRDAMLRLAAVPISEPEPLDERCHRADLADRAARGLELLSPPLREAFVLAEIEGFTGAEAAKILGIPPGTLRRRLFDARRRLLQMLEGGR